MHYGVFWSTSCCSSPPPKEITIPEFTYSTWKVNSKCSSQGKACLLFVCLARKGHKWVPEGAEAGQLMFFPQLAKGNTLWYQKWGPWKWSEAGRTLLWRKANLIECAVRKALGSWEKDGWRELILIQWPKLQLIVVVALTDHGGWAARWPPSLSLTLLSTWHREKTRWKSSFVKIETGR